MTPAARTGSIPACAGEPATWFAPGIQAVVYPRVCGGTPRATAPTPRPKGLSPRVRGNREAGGYGHQRERSIPACAGEPGTATASPTKSRVYPRVCGGTFTAMGDTLTGLGLSPRVRGNRARVRAAQHDGRSIPACAGEPTRRNRLKPLTTVYPRVCGGTSVGTGAWSETLGLSPRVRGNRNRHFRPW